MTQEAGSTSRGEQTRNNILDAAERLFAKNGYSATRLDDVAEVVGISRPTVIYYYPDKGELYVAVQRRLNADTQRILEAVPDTSDLPLEERLIQLLDAWFNFIISRPNLPVLLLRNFVDTNPVEPGREPINAAVLEQMVSMIRQGQKEDKFDPMLEPGHVITAIGNMLLAFFTTGPLLKGRLATRPYKTKEQERYRALLHKSFRAMLLPD